MNAKSQSWLKNLLAAITREQPTILHMAIGFVLASFLTAGLNYKVSAWSKKDEIVSSRSNELQESASDFENRVSAFIRSGKDFNNFDSQQLAELNRNIESQIKALNKIRTLLYDGKQIDDANEYARNLIIIRKLLDDGLQPEETVAFGKAALKLSSLKVDLISSLS